METSTDAVTGTAIVVSDGHGGVRKVAGSSGGCNGCAWKMVPSCIVDAGSNSGASEDVCGNGTLGFRCTNGVNGEPRLPYRVFYRSGPGAPWIQTSTVCLGPQQAPISTDALLADVQRYVDRLVPPAPALRMQPGEVDHLTLVNLPTLFQAPTPAVPPATFFPAAIPGVQVEVAVAPRAWRWNVDGGASVFTTDFPGRRYDDVHDPRYAPELYAAHTWGIPGEHTISATVEWTATATVRGLGELPVPGTVERTSPVLRLRAAEARAQLVS